MVWKPSAFKEGPLSQPYDDFLGRELFGFTLVEMLGEGALGAVFRAEKGTRQLAVRVLPASFATAEAMTAQIIEQARTLGGLKHPNLLHIYKIFQAKQHLCLTMRFADGGSLRERLARDGAVDAERAARWTRQIAEGLQAAAEAGIHHGDLNPGNVLLSRRDRVMLVNFGLAAPCRISASRTLLGDPGYMSPERCREDAPPDAVSDLYSLGCLLYEMLNGRPAFVDASPGDVMVKQLFEAPAHLECTDVPLTLVDILDRLLKKDPAERLGDPSALLAELARLRASSEAVSASSGLPVTVGPGAAIPPPEGEAFSFNDSSVQLEVSDAAVYQRDLPELRLPAEPEVGPILLEPSDGDIDLFEPEAASAALRDPVAPSASVTAPVAPPSAPASSQVRRRSRRLKKSGRVQTSTPPDKLVLGLPPAILALIAVLMLGLLAVLGWMVLG